MEAHQDILVVDDEAEMQELTTAILRQNGYPVQTATDGHQALAMLADQSFALVITDLIMPGVTGLDVLAEVKARTPTTEVILVTAYGAVESAVEAMRQGAHDYIIKPFSHQELSHSVERALTYRRLKLEKTELLANLQQHNEELRRMLEASNRLAQLRPQPNLPLAEIIEIAQQQLGLTIAITIVTENGQFLQTEIPPHLQMPWGEILAKTSPGEEQLQRLFTNARRLSRSYLLEAGKENLKNGGWAQASKLPDTPLLAVPLETHHSRLLGALWLVDVEQPPSMDLIRRLEIFANQVIGVLENANLFITQARQVHVRNTLVQASQRIATVLDQQEVVRTILEAILKIMPRIELAIIYYRTNGETKLKAIGITGQGDLVSPPPDFDEALISETLDHKQTIYQPNWKGNGKRANKSLIIKPLVLTGAALGALIVISRQSAAFDDDHQQVLTMLANQATIALQNARLYAEARRVDELEALHEAGKAINRTLDLQETLTTTMAIARSLTGASISNVYLYTPDHQRIDSVVTLGEELSLSDADRRRSAEIAWEVLASHRPALIVEPEPRSQRSRSKRVRGNRQIIQTWLAVPLITSASPVGVLELSSERVAAFTADDARLMQIIASQAAAAIENARLYEEVQQRLQQTEALSAISQSISMTLELQRVLELVVHSAAKTIPVATHSVLYLLDQAGESLIPEAKVTTRDRSLPPELEQVRQKAIQQAARQSAIIRAPWQSEEHGSWSLLVAPLKVGKTVIGAISVESPHQDAFLPSDETLLTTFASHASIAIQNANLFRDLSSTYLDLAHKQEEILRSHRTLQALFDGITDGLYIVDRELKILAINQAEAKRLGRMPTSLLGHSCDSSLWGEAAEAVAKIVQDTFEVGTERNWESQIDVIKRGPFTDRDVRTYPIFEATEEVSQVIIFAQDVSEKRRLQASLFRSANLAAVGQLASGIAHQINNPLTVIIANCQLMEMQIEPNSPDYPMITHILEAGTQIRQIVQNLLDFSTQERYDWFETDLPETIDDALDLVAHSLRKSHIEVVKQIEALPAIIGSASHLKLLWMNLLLNARDAICKSDDERIIEILAMQVDSERVQIQITDTGPGILPQHRDRLFHPFFTTKSTGKNLGLGLYTCRTIVESHQGQIKIDNKQNGRGTKVTVILPVQITAPPVFYPNVLNR